jgi:periodic tryptophan protein 2
VEEREENEGGNVTIRLPGVRVGDMASRSMKPEIRVFSLEFSPTGNIQKLICVLINNFNLISVCVYLLFEAYNYYYVLSGQAWSAATTEGLLVYSLNVEFIFDPFQLEIGITPITVKEALAKKEFSTGAYSNNKN